MSVDDQSEPKAVRGRFAVAETMHVRWGDMDALGHVNNTAFFVYFESLRTSYFERIGLWALGTSTGHGPALVSTSCEFRRQLRWPATLTVGADITRLGTSSFTMAYTVVEHGVDEPAAFGEAVVVWTDYERGRSAPIPDVLRRRIAAGLIVP